MHRQENMVCPAVQLFLEQLKEAREERTRSLLSKTRKHWTLTDC
jgi:hypothetical protein